MTPAADLSERDAWLALVSVEGIGEGMLGRFIRRFGSGRETLAVAAGTDGSRALQRLLDAAPSYLTLMTAARVRAAAMDPHAITRRIEDDGGWALTPLDPDYPARLRELDPPPVAVYGMGPLDVVTELRSVAVVGTRHPTPSGRALAAAVARRLVEVDAVVTSGLAVGIDGAAHAATLEAGGRTVAVIGGGFDHPGPRAHDRLRRAILDGGGTILSEHAPHVAPTRGTFPRRNRIISVLTLGTIVVEAPIRSGALITARHALEQGRRLLVAPGRPGDAASAGCLNLLRETPARPLVGLDELVVDLGLDSEPMPGARPDAAPRLGYQTALGMLGPVERDVARVLHDGPTTIDAIIGRTGQPAPVVAGALTLLQLRGWSQPVGAMQLPCGPLLAATPRPGARSGVVR
jgi:DNA processing protein